PSVNLTEATVGVKVMSTHLLTSAPIINIPSMDAPFVISCKIPPDKSSVILEPALYPPSCVYHINDILNKFQNMKSLSGPRILPDTANEAAIAPSIGFNVNQNTGSPIPAKGPIIPTLTP